MQLTTPPLPARLHRIRYSRATNLTDGTTVRHDMESVGEILGRLANEVKAREDAKKPRLAAGRLVDFAFLASGVALGFIALTELAYGWFGAGWRFNHGDLTIYTDAARSLFNGGSWYLERQTTGPYALEFGDVLYPPVASLAFAPWLVLPGWSFVLIPTLIVGWFVWTEHPKAWAWPLIGLCLVWPMTGLKWVSANPTIWIAAFVALGLRYRWAGALALLKPSFLPLALIGIRSRGWWVTAGVLGLLSLPFLAATVAYPSVVLNAQGGGLLYSLVDLPMALIPAIAWRARR